MDQGQRINQRGDWEEALRSKFQEYEPTISELPPLVLPQRNNPFVLWRWLAVAASIAAVIVLVLLFTRESAQDLPSQFSTVPPTLLSVENNDVLEEVPPFQHHFSGVSDESTCQVVPTDENMLASNFTQKRTHNGVIAEEASDNTEQDNDFNAKRSVSDNEDTSNGVLATPTKSTQRPTPQKKREIKLSLFTSGTTLSANSVAMSQVADGIIAGEQSNYLVQETPMMEIGSTVLLPIAQRWAIQTGLKYSWYRIEVKDNRFVYEDSYILDVHSLGIPLDIQYSLYNSKLWRLYSQYGVGVNIPLKSTITGSIRDNGGATLSFDTSLALGLEYNINSQVALYTGLGVTYDLLQMKSNLPDADISRWHGKFEAGIRFRIKR